MSEETSAQPTQPVHAARAPSRWWAAVRAGTLVCIPIGWLLSFGGGLPFFLGLFFYMLLGIAIGAVMYRVGHTARPVPVRHFRLGLAIVVLVGWSISVWVEGRDFPSDAADQTLNQFRRLPDGMTPEHIKRESREYVRGYLREQYPPGGVLGYIRWMTTNGRMTVKIEGVDSTRPLRFHTIRGWWVFRVLGSLALFLYAVRSQVLVLRKPHVSE
jgi:hypothetical protein